MERTYAAQVRGADEIKVCGFVENIRNKSKMAFIVLKDITGKVQITVEKGEDEALDNAVNQITLDSVITVIGKDMVGILARVSSICAENNVNVVEVTQSILQDLFAMIMMVDISKCSIPFQDLVDALTAIGEGMGLTIHVMHEDIFNSMHRI